MKSSIDSVGRGFSSPKSPIDSVDRHFSSLKSPIDSVGLRFSSLKCLIDSVGRRFSGLESRIDSVGWGFSSLKCPIDSVGRCSPQKEGPHIGMICGPCGYFSSDPSRPRPNLKRRLITSRLALVEAILVRLPVRLLSFSRWRWRSRRSRSTRSARSRRSCSFC